MIFLIVYSRIHHAYLVGCRQRKLSFSNGTCCAVDILVHPPTATYQNKKCTVRVHFLFWWEWVDSNHLSRKTTDLQSAPALQLRRTPKTQLMVRAAGIEPAFQAWKACILALELCSPLVYRPCDYILFFYKRKYLFCYFYTVYVFTRNTFKFHRLIIWV